MIVESAGGKDNNVLELARTHFGSNSKDFITAVDESNVIVVKEFAETDTGKEIEKSARALEAALLKEGIREIRIAYGTIVHEIKGSQPFLQGSQDGTGCRQNLLR